MQERKAIIIVSSDLANPGRGASVAASVLAYRNRLDDLGFDTVVLGPASRPDLDRIAREAPARIQPGGEVAVFVVGPTLSANDDLYLIPSDSTADLSPASPGLETETLRLSFVLRRLKASAPREIVVVVDECHAPTAATCVPAYLRETNNQSLVAARGAREPRDDTTEETLRRAILAAMTVEGDAFDQFRDHLAADTAPNGFRIEGSQPLSRTFSFFQRGHFQRVSENCFHIDPDANEVAAQDSRIASWTQSCEADAARWPFVDAIRLHAAAGREQVAFQMAVTPPCQNSARAQQYLVTYSNGRYTTAVQKFLDQCSPPPQQEPPTRTANVEEAARSLLDRYYRIHGQRGRGGESFSDLYAPTVEFYGHPTPREKVVAAKRDYFEQYSDAVFNVRQDTVTINCVGQNCTATGVLDLTLTRSENGRTNTFTSQFEFVFSDVTTNPRVISESARKWQ
jgi:hypothetical protein